MYCITVTQFLHVFVPALHGYSRTRDTVITCGYLLYWTLLLHVLVDLLHGSCIAPILLFYSYLLSHRLTNMHVMIVFEFPLHWTLFMLHELLLHRYSCIPITWLFLVTNIDMIFLLLDMWAVDMQCVEQCATSKPRGPPIESHISCSRFPLFCLCYQQSPCSIIVLHVPCNVLVPDTLCSLNIIDITWGWGRLGGWLDLVGWISGSIVSSTAGDMVVLATIR